MYLANAYPNSAISAGAMTAIALVAAGTLALWLIFVFLADRNRPKDARQAGSSLTMVAKSGEATEDEHSEDGHAPAGSWRQTAA